MPRDGKEIDENGYCPVCSPYPNRGFQQLYDGQEVPCFACNRAEFEKYALLNHQPTSAIKGDVE